MPSSERRKEIKRRRHRREKVARYRSRLEKASPSEKQAIAEKLRLLTPGSEVLIDNWSLVER